MGDGRGVGISTGGIAELLRYTEFHCKEVELLTEQIRFGGLSAPLVVFGGFLFDRLLILDEDCLVQRERALTHRHRSTRVREHGRARAGDGFDGLELGLKLNGLGLVLRDEKERVEEGGVGGVAGV